jgi:predicted NAD/FAD-dependent oxidoreductase
MPGVLAAAGRDVKVLEQGNDVGGRIRTDSIDGFLCDRGFQVLNPAYPELHRAADISALRLQPFGAGVAVRREHSTAPPESATRKHAAAIMGAEPRPWNVLTRTVISHALPAQPAPLRVRRPVRLTDGLWWCGDHRDTASIQGALVSGRRTAEQILRTGN